MSETIFSFFSASRALEFQRSKKQVNSGIWAPRITPTLANPHLPVLKEQAPRVMRQWRLFTSTDIDRFGSTPNFRIFVPNYIPTGMTGDQKVEILVGIQIDSADVV